MRAALIALQCLALGGCLLAGGAGEAPGADAGMRLDAGSDAALGDGGGAVDAGPDAGLDATVPPDAGAPDAGDDRSDAGDAGAMAEDSGPDAGSDAGPDAGSDAGSDAGPDAGPTCDAMYGAAPGYVFCTQPAVDECEFFTAHPTNQTCTTICAALGGSCRRRWRDAPGDACGHKDFGARACGTTGNTTDICVCTL